MEHNNVYLVGLLEDEFRYSHKSHGKEYEKTIVAVDRLSGTIDYIPLIRKKRKNNYNAGDFIKVTGYGKTVDYEIDGNNHSLVYVVANDVDESESYEFQNKIELDGYVCKVGECRHTQSNGVICDFTIAVNNMFNSSYFHCISWGFNAVKCADLFIGQHIHIIGRLQSREYVKPDSENRKIAYEISVSNLVIL